MAENNSGAADNMGMAGWLAKSGNRNASMLLSLIAVWSVGMLLVDSRFLYLLVYLWFGAIYGLFLQ